MLYRTDRGEPAYDQAGNSTIREDVSGLYTHALAGLHLAGRPEVNGVRKFSLLCVFKAFSGPLSPRLIPELGPGEIWATLENCQADAAVNCKGWVYARQQYCERNRARLSMFSLQNRKATAYTPTLLVPSDDAIRHGNIDQTPR